MTFKAFLNYCNKHNVNLVALMHQEFDDTVFEEVTEKDKAKVIDAIGKWEIMESHSREIGKSNDEHKIVAYFEKHNIYIRLEQSTHYEDYWVEVEPEMKIVYLKK